MRGQFRVCFGAFYYRKNLAGAMLLTRFPNCNVSKQRLHVFVTYMVFARSIGFSAPNITGNEIFKHREAGHRNRTQGVKRDVVSRTALLTEYARNRRIGEARQVFDEMPERNVVTWNAMVTGYCQNGRMKDARQLFDTMPERDVISWTTMITGYSQNGAIDEARQLFDRIRNQSLVTWNAMIAGYCQSGRTEDARELFDKMHKRIEVHKKNVVTWTAMIAGYAQIGQGEEALKLFSQMQRIGMKPNQSTFSSVLNACATLAAPNEGQQIHSLILKTGFESDLYEGNALITVHVKCGSMGYAWKAFNQMH